MTPEQAAAFIQSQTVCALAEIEAMKAENALRAQQDFSPAYSEDSFRAIPDEFGIDRDSVAKIFSAAI